MALAIRVSKRSRENKKIVKLKRVQQLSRNFDLAAAG